MVNSLVKALFCFSVVVLLSSYNVKQAHGQVVDSLPKDASNKYAITSPLDAYIPQMSGMFASVEDNVSNSLSEIGASEANLENAGTSMMPRWSFASSESNPLRTQKKHYQLPSTNLEKSLYAILKKSNLSFDNNLQQILKLDNFAIPVEKGDTAEVLIDTTDEKQPVLVGLKINLAEEPTPIFIYRYTTQGDPTPRYYSLEGYEYANKLLNSPMEYISISSFLGDGRNHKGLDLRAPIGTPVMTPFLAQVERVNWYMATQGKCVQLLYIDLGIRAKFFHLDDIFEDIVPGKILAPGDVFALSGNTGRSTGPHLHYQLEDSNTNEILDPIDVHGYGSPRLPGKEFVKFENAIAKAEKASVIDSVAPAMNARADVSSKKNN